MTGEYLSKDGVTIKVQRAFSHPDRPQPMQHAGMPPYWVHVGGQWRMLGLYCDRVRFLFWDAIQNSECFTELEFLELIHDCLDH
jgi:hypothetical protein